MTQPVENLAGAFYDAIHNQFSDLEYWDRDWPKYSKWQEEVFRKLSKEEQKAFYDEERHTGVHMGPEDCRVFKKRRPSSYEAGVYAMFRQSWGSTSLGFGGIGGQAITTAYTIVVECISEYAVYFGGRFAYLITQPNEKFFEDVAAQQLADVAHKSKYARLTT